jgi:uncharacterized protein (DUF58 family)
MWNANINKDECKATSGVEVTLQELIALRLEAMKEQHQGLNKTLNLPGQKLTVTRGRGIEFDATREYQAGDDIRSMAWRVTARTLKPHIKIYREEQERPVWLAVDLSPSQFFGTRCMFKSVKTIKVATKLGWAYLLKRERIGAVIAAENPLTFSPQSSERHYLTILDALAVSSRLRTPFSDLDYLNQLLNRLQFQVRSDNLVFIVSDFFHFNAANQKLIMNIARRAQVVMTFIYDPLEAEPPPAHDYVITNGVQSILFNMHDKKNRQLYQHQFQAKQDQLIEFAHKYNIRLQIVRTNE